MEGSVQRLKALLRADIRKRITGMSSQQKQRESQWIIDSVCNDRIFTRSNGIAVYISIPSEVDTMPIIERILSDGKRLYVPYIDGSNPMAMLRVESSEDLSTFVRDKMGILEPPRETVAHRADALKEMDLDLILIPGLAFDVNGHRLGKGKGYYDHFLNNYMGKCESLGKPQPTLAGLAFSVQIVDNVPTASHDFVLHRVIFPTEVSPEETKAPPSNQPE